MQSLEGEWKNGMLAALPTTSTGCLVQWQTFIERSANRETWADYPWDESLKLDAAFQTDKRPVTLGVSPDTWTIDLNRMMQLNDETGMERPIRCLVIVKNCLPQDTARSAHRSAAVCFCCLHRSLIVVRL